MPIYEYICSVCGYRFEKLVRSITPEGSSAACPQCQAEDAKRLLSSFAVRAGGSVSSSMSAPVSIGDG